MRQSLPCIVCGAALENVLDDSENQPSNGLAFETTGAYGSTAFDPMDGSELMVNICDPCLLQAQLRGEVLWGRIGRPVLAPSSLPDFKLPEQVGMERVDRPLLPWNGDGSGDYTVDIVRVDREDIGRTDGLFKNVDWNPALVEAERKR